MIAYHSFIKKEPAWIRQLVVMATFVERPDENPSPSTGSSKATATTTETNNTHYETLGVPESADTTTIKEAFRSLVLLHHPDKNAKKNDDSNGTDSSLLVNQIQQAYQVLRDASKRSKYDEGLRLERQRRQGRLESAIVVERADCRIEIDEHDGSNLCVYPCRCGALLDTSPIDDDDEDDEQSESDNPHHDEEDGLLECPGCSLVYDIRKLSEDASKD